MDTFWILNLDAEYELAEPRGYQPRQSVLRGFEASRQLARTLLQRGDHEVSLEEVRRGAAAGQRLRAWCPTPSVREACLAGEAHLEAAPPFEVLRRVNDRGFAAQLEPGFPGARYFPMDAANPGAPDQESALRGHLDTQSGNWLLKRAWSVAGRGCRRIRGAEWAEPDARWVAASLRVGGLQVERCVSVEAEFSQHGWLSREGRLWLGEPCQFRAREKGESLEVQLAGPSAFRRGEQVALMEATERVGRALFEADYFGPYGLDAFRWSLGPETGFRALSELNARYTLAWSCGMKRIVSPSGTPRGGATISVEEKSNR